eukprot:2507018-Amphidinium_carterae.1
MLRMQCYPTRASAYRYLPFDAAKVSLSKVLHPSRHSLSKFLLVGKTQQTPSKSEHGNLMLSTRVDGRRSPYR